MSGSMEGATPKIDDAAILKRAKQLCEQNGTLWETDYRPANRRARERVALDEAGRREYLMRAREQLIKEKEQEEA